MLSIMLTMLSICKAMFWPQKLLVLVMSRGFESGLRDETGVPGADHIL